MGDEYPKEVKMEQVESLIGLYTVLWRKQAKQAAKFIGTEEDTDGKRVVYELLSDPDKGELFSARYDPSQVVIAYDEGTKVMALLDG